jgi:hypothetical protein
MVFIFFNLMFLIYFLILFFQIYYFCLLSFYVFREVNQKKGFMSSQGTK